MSKIELDFTISYGFHRIPMFLSTLQFVYFFFYFNRIVNSILIRYDGNDEDYIIYIYIFFFIVHNSKGENAIYSQS